MTTIKLTRRTRTIIGQLTGKTQSTANTIPLCVLSSKTGVTNLVEEQDRTIGADNVTPLQNNIRNIIDFSWQKTMNANEFVVGIL